MAVSVDTILKLSLDSAGYVWYMAGECQPVNSGQRLVEFVNSEVLADATHVRVAGCAANAQLLLMLNSCRLQHRLQLLEVISPQVAHTAAERAEPEQLLMRMHADAQFLTSSLGGWHEFNLSDYPNYAMAAELRSRNGNVTETTHRLLLTHPAWKALGFIPHLDRANLCRLLAVILDPRWYIDTHYPDRVGRLETFLGLTPRCSAALAAGDLTSPKVQLCKLVRDTWMTSPGVPADVAMPGYFLWRAWAVRKDPALATLRTSQSFIAYLRHVWLDALYGCTVVCRDPLFDAERYFRCHDTSLAFAAHMSQSG